MSLAVYVRVSTEDQSQDSQKAEIQTWLARQLIDSKAEWYTDVASSKTLDRPAFNRLQADVESGKIKTVVVWKLDRLSRSWKAGLNLIEDWTARGVRIISLTQNVDFNGHIGKLIAIILAWVAEWEYETRKERQEAGIKVAKKKKKFKGRAPGANKRTLEMRGKVLKMERAGRPIAEISRATGLSRVTVRKVLNEASTCV